MSYASDVAYALAIRDPHFQGEGHTARLGLAAEPRCVAQEAFSWSAFTEENAECQVFQNIPCTCGKMIYAGVNLLDGSELGKFIRDICQ